ncbi:MAG: hypothetical protein V1743_06860 [Nanoarchaeota archaeon]
MSWGKRIFIGTLAVYLSYMGTSTFARGWKGKEFNYVVDQLGNKNGRMGTLEFSYLEKCTEHVGAELEVQSVCLAYLLEKDDQRIPVPGIYWNLESFVEEMADSTYKPIENYAPSTWMREYTLPSKKRKDPVREPLPEKVGIVEFSFIPNYAWYDAPAKFWDYTYYTYERGTVQPETFPARCKRLLKILIN